MDVAFLVQMRQSNKCRSVRNDEIFNLHLGDLVWALEAVSLVPCNTSATFIDSISPNNPPGKNKLGNVINTVVNTKMFPDSDINKL